MTPFASSAPTIPRRRFLQISATSAGGLLIAGWLPSCHRTSPTAVAAPFKPNPFLQIDPDETVHIWAPRPDVGEGTKTSLPLLVADELEADWSRVRVHQADLDSAAFGDQGVGGSDSVPASWKPLRQAGAAGRQLLTLAAAQAWGVSPASCVAQASTVLHPPTGRRLTYGVLSSAASKLALPKTAPALKKPGEFRLIGQRLSGVDNPAIATGRPLYGIDVRRPGMLFAVIARCPVAGGQLLSFDATEARRISGVRQIVKIEGLERPTWLRPGIAVVADSTWAAIKGRDALQLTWNEGPGGNVDSDGISTQFQLLESQPGTFLRRAGDVDRALAGAPHRVDAVYELPLLAHVSMEPMNCTAHVQGAKCDVWGPIQLPSQAQQMVAKATGLQKEAIAIHPTRIGGSFGRRLASDFAAEAAYVAKAVDRPVQVVWTREDDVRGDFYRPAAYHHVRAAVTADGTVTGWRHHIVTLPNSMYPEATGTEGLLAPRSDNLKADLSDGFRPCLIPNFELILSTARIPVQTGSLRAPENNANAFVIQSMIDELAHASRVDPLELQSRLLGNASDFPYPGRSSSGLYNPDRLKAVLGLAAVSAGWGTKLSPRRGRGIAAHHTNNSYAAYVIEVEVDPSRRLDIRRVVVAIDCGTPVNRSGIEAQAQGGTLDALSAALFGEITLARGRSVQDNFTNYRWLRNHEAPAIQIHLVESREAPTGLGEIPYPPVAPALTNAIFSAIGERIRRLPLSRHGFTLVT